MNFNEVRNGEKGKKKRSTFIKNINKRKLTSNWKRPINNKDILLQGE
ncbi:hypothetical protein J5Y03_02760 [Bacillus sp. RG28]|uniref:Uncharacterized protein n=1 Tax=Gottfriedia endophytica TaxID=2820819 RepID=A0A940NMD1_9BACI|nr:hypothetical protein [Gottfriedia endophytica]MBP0724103.1 hypothetical protein [Gottfriedia endophytica]